jgi:hypothetical protein
MSSDDMPGVIKPGRLYLVREARQRLRLGDQTWHELCDEGLRVIHRGRNAYVFSDDLLRIFGQPKEDATR